MVKGVKSNSRLPANHGWTRVFTPAATKERSITGDQGPPLVGEVKNVYSG